MQVSIASMVEATRIDMIQYIGPDYHGDLVSPGPNAVAVFQNWRDFYRRGMPKAYSILKNLADDGCFMGQQARTSNHLTREQSVRSLLTNHRELSQLFKDPSDDFGGGRFRGEHALDLRFVEAALLDMGETLAGHDIIPLSSLEILDYTE
jgi:hypothetical protein